MRPHFYLYLVCLPLLGRRSALGSPVRGGWIPSMNHCLSHLRAHQGHLGPVKTLTVGRHPECLVHRPGRDPGRYRCCCPKTARRTVGAHSYGGPGWDRAETTPSSSSGADSALGGRKQDKWTFSHVCLSPAVPRELPAPCGTESECGHLVLGLLEHPHPCKVGHRCDLYFIGEEAEAQRRQVTCPRSHSQ